MNAVNNDRSSKPEAVAIVLAATLLLSAGAGYRSLAAKLERTDERPAILAGTLQQLPTEIGTWVGADQELDETLIKRADVDDHLMRVYRRSADQSTVGLWIAYGARARDLMPHRPEVCYPGAGWTMQGQEIVEIEGAGDVVRARLLTFASSGQDARPLKVLTYYIIDGRTCEDASLLRSKAWRGQSSMRYMTQIQISCRVSTLSTKSPDKTLLGFAAESFMPILNLLERGVESGNVSEPG